MLPGCDIYKTIIDMEDPNVTEHDAVIGCPADIVQLQLWDVGNSKDFNIQDAGFILICFSINDRQTFDNIKEYV
jgi:GTPase SAR1 family protein